MALIHQPRSQGPLVLSPRGQPWPTVANRGHGGRVGEDPGNEVFDLPANSS